MYIMYLCDLRIFVPMQLHVRKATLVHQASICDNQLFKLIHMMYAHCTGPTHHQKTSYTGFIMQMIISPIIRRPILQLARKKMASFWKDWFDAFERNFHCYIQLVKQLRGKVTGAVCLIFKNVVKLLILGKILQLVFTKLQRAFFGMFYLVLLHSTRHVVSLLPFLVSFLGHISSYHLPPMT